MRTNSKKSNWVPDKNRFSLPSPPEWFLRALSDYDDQLVVIPSRQVSVYRIARRSKQQPGSDINIGAQSKRMNITDFDHSEDTKMLYSLRLVPVLTLQPWVTWNLDLIGILRSRDITAQGGWEKVADQLDKAEEQEKQRADKEAEDALLYRLGDAYRSIQYREGLRIPVSGKRGTPGGWKKDKGTQRPVVSRPIDRKAPMIVAANEYTKLPSTARQ